MYTCAMAKIQVVRTRQTTDPEIAAISKIGKLVEGLEKPAKARVLNYVHQRFCLDEQVNAPAANSPALAAQQTLLPN